MIASRSARPALLGAVLITFGGLAWYYFLPAVGRGGARKSAAVLNVLMVLIFALTVVVFVLLVPWPVSQSGLALAGLRRLALPVRHRRLQHRRVHPRGGPQAVHVYNVVLGNRCCPEQVPELRKHGLPARRCLDQSLYMTMAHIRELTRDDGCASIDGELQKLPPQGSRRPGRGDFPIPLQRLPRDDLGYSAVGPLLQGDRARDGAFEIDHLDAVFFMPPWCGTPAGSRAADGLLMSDQSTAAGGNDIWHRIGRLCSPERRIGGEGSLDNREMQ